MATVSIVSLVISFALITAIKLAKGQTSCLGNEFQCSSSECITLAQFCDGTENCPDGSDEHNCQVPCGTITCQNGGSCINASGMSECNCTSAFFGDQCQYVNPCTSVTCMNNGNCFLQINTTDPMMSAPFCMCTNGFTGSLCETELQTCLSNPCPSGFSCTTENGTLQCVTDCDVDICNSNGVCSLIIDPVIQINRSSCICNIGFTGEFCETNIDECANDPCLNGGMCTDGVAMFTCQCLDGFLGSQCQDDRDDCGPMPCENGRCQDFPNNYTCECFTGFSGRNCSVNIDDCLPDSCMNGGTCNDVVSGFSCDCPYPYGGSTCEFETNCTITQDTCMNGGLCEVFNGTSACNCSAGFTGVNCEFNINECDSNPCQNGATCLDSINDVVCDCTPQYTGKYCDEDVNECDNNPCQNGALCRNQVDGFECRCAFGFTGILCAINIDDCIESNCTNGGTCVDEIGEFACVCPDGYAGLYCELDELGDECLVGPCKNATNCTDTPGLMNFVCTCQPGFTGTLCDTVVDPCAENPCMNDGVCAVTNGNTSCTCNGSYYGPLCEHFDDCAIQPCLNNGTCVDLPGGYLCDCNSQFTGTNCSEMIVDPCFPNPCQSNGTCNSSSMNNYTCVCVNGFTGSNCEINVDDCAINPCIRGNCTDEIANYTCTCLEGFTGKNCSDEINECDSNPCLNNGTCSDLIGGFECSCLPGYTGGDCGLDVNECDPNPCMNNGTCIDITNGFECQCSAEYVGTSCENRIDNCVNVTCMNNGTCVDGIGSFECSCSPGFSGNLCDVNIDDCSSNPCYNNGTCRDLVNGYICTCPLAATGPNCSSVINPCDAEPCSNGGQCEVNGLGFLCMCVGGYTGDTCDIEVDECGLMNPCAFNSTCRNINGSFVCDCVRGTTGNNCEINLNDCAIPLCLNNGTCIDGIGTFSCNCPIDYTGQICEQQINDCNPNLCQNGAECLDGIGDFTCVCPTNFTGSMCEVDLNSCRSSPCQNGGTCVEGQGNTTTCMCAPGFTGDYCEIDLDFCTLDLCQNGGTCAEGQGNTTTCMCAPGFTGDYCEIDLDFCTPNSCQNGGTCVEGQGNTTTCMCAPGFRGDYCEIDLDFCTPDLCQNGGTCAEGQGNTTTCMCAPGFTGDYCEIDLDFCTPDLCQNGGTCAEGQGNTTTCMCAPGFTGDYCEIDLDFCTLDLCQNGGTCVEGQGNTTTCVCVPGFIGDYCEIDLDFCTPNSCQNGGTCVEGQGNTTTCMCAPGFRGDYCEIDLDFCTPDLCQNGGTCAEGQGNTTTCMCVPGFTGDYCEIDLDFCTPNSCQNGGTCVEGQGNTTTCMCAPGFTGDYCEIDLDFCTPDLCQNGGTCVEGQGNTTTCMCAPGFTGDYCEIDLDFCTLDLCQNGGTCAEGQGNTTTCVCVPGFTGDYCEIDLDFCTPDLCQNGGTCIEDIGTVVRCMCAPGFIGDYCEEPVCVGSNCTSFSICKINNLDPKGYQCLCPIGFNGEFCDEELDVQVPSFDGDSLLTFNITNFAINTFSLDLTIKPDISNGYVAMVTSVVNPMNYISLYYQDGFLVMSVRLFDVSQNITYPGNTTDGNWHVVTIATNQSEMTLSVDQAVFQASINSMDYTFDGVVQLGNSAPCLLAGSCTRQQLERGGFVGCIRDLQLNGEPHDIIEDAASGYNIVQCAAPICSYVECLNGGTCNNEATNNFTCMCLAEYTGRFCEIQIDVCLPSPCLFGGVCLANDTSFYCQCPFRRAGRLCEQTLNISVYQFNGASYIGFPPIEAVDNSLISIRLRPQANNGLILFNSMTNYEMGDYIAIVMINGCVVFRYNLGSNDSVIASTRPLQLGEWHVVTVSREGRMGSLMVDTEEPIRGESPAPFTGLNVGSTLWLGGIDNFMNITSVVGTSAGFVGCIHYVRVNDKELLLSNAIFGMSVGECDVQPCDINPCENGGTCEVVGNGTGFTCNCLSGFSGPSCENIEDPCTDSPCSAGSTCVPNMSNGMINFLCECPPGIVGVLCNIPIAMATPSFNGSSYMEFPEPSSVAVVTTINILVLPTASNGVLLYSGASFDFMALVLFDSVVQFRFQLGSRTAVLSSQTSLELGLWYSIVVTRNGKEATLQINNEVTGNVTARGTASQLNINGNLFIGGISEMASVSRDLNVREGFKGCISKLEINGDTYSFGEALTSRAVTICDEDPCIPNPCQNGGMCSATDSSFQCDCLVGFTGESCQTPLPISVPSFSGNSFISYASLTGAYAYTRLVVEFHPSSANGLILYNGNIRLTDFIAVLLRDAIPEFRFDLGTGVAIIRGTSPIALNRWHRVEVERSGNMGQMIIDGSVPFLGNSPGDFVGLQLGNSLFLGSYNDISLISLQIQMDVGFMGCVRLLQTTPTNEALDLIGAALSGRDIGSCSVVQSCRDRGCANNGTCEEDLTGMNGFTCNCAQGYFGEFCEYTTINCTISNPCENGGACIISTMPDGVVQHQCQCYLPYGGELCNERESFTEANFTSSSFLEFQSNTLNLDRMISSSAIEITFIAMDGNGLLLYIGPSNAGNEDFIYLALFDNHIIFRFDLGSGEGVLEHPLEIQLGATYTVIAKQTGGIGTLELQGFNAITGASPGSNVMLNVPTASTVVYLGGAPNLNVINVAAETGFNGCIQNVKIGAADNTMEVSLRMATNGHLTFACL